MFNQTVLTRCLCITQHILQVLPADRVPTCSVETDRWQQRAMRPQQLMPQGPHCNTIKMYVSFIPVPAPSLCHFSGRPDFQRGAKSTSTTGSGDTKRKKRRGTPGWRGMGCRARDNTVEHVLYHLCCGKISCMLCGKGNTSRVWICDIAREKVFKKLSIIQAVRKERLNFC